MLAINRTRPATMVICNNENGNYKVFNLKTNCYSNTYNKLITPSKET